MNGAIYALRIKLSDFMNDPLESSVVDKIHEIYNFTGRQNPQIFQRFSVNILTYYVCFTWCLYFQLLFSVNFFYV